MTHIPLGGINTSMNGTAKKSVLTRLKRIEGQLGGLHRMVEDDRYCIDVLTQINAVRAALHKVEAEVLRNHVTHCVADTEPAVSASGAWVIAGAAPDSNRPSTPKSAAIMPNLCIQPVRT